MTLKSADENDDVENKIVRFDGQLQGYVSNDFTFTPMCSAIEKGFNPPSPENSEKSWDEETDD